MSELTLEEFAEEIDGLVEDIMNAIINRGNHRGSSILAALASVAKMGLSEIEDLEERGQLLEAFVKLIESEPDPEDLH